MSSTEKKKGVFWGLYMLVNLAEIFFFIYFVFI